MKTEKTGAHPSDAIRTGPAHGHSFAAQAPLCPAASGAGCDLLITPSCRTAEPRAGAPASPPPAAWPNPGRLLRRRGFVKTFALFSASSWIAGKELATWLVGNVSAATAGPIGIFRMTLDSFPALKADLGSVRLRVTGMQLSFPAIIVTRVPGDLFFAVTSVCTHEGFTVEPYTARFQALRCPLHGSQFNPDGTVRKGPATSRLERYKTTFDGRDTVAIEIPGLGFSLTIVEAAVPGSGAGRVALEFPTVTGVSYELRFRASLGEGDWAQVPFATTPEGAANLTFLRGNNKIARVYVDGGGENGFYAAIRR